MKAGKRSAKKNNRSKAKGGGGKRRSSVHAQAPQNAKPDDAQHWSDPFIDATIDAVGEIAIKAVAKAVMD